MKQAEMNIMQASNLFTNTLSAVVALGLSLISLNAPARADQLRSGLVHDGNYDYTDSVNFNLPQPPKPPNPVSGEPTASTSPDIQTNSQTGNSAKPITRVAANGPSNSQLRYFASDLIDTSNSGGKGNAVVPTPH